MTDARAEHVLNGLGIAFEREPSWVRRGRKPDFYCKAWPPFWVEVKTLERPGSTASATLAALQQRIPVPAWNGYGIVFVGVQPTARDAKVIARLVNRAGPRLSEPGGPRLAVALIPKDPDYLNFVRFAVSTHEHSSVEFHCCASMTGKYGTPTGLHPEPEDQLTHLAFSSGKKKSLPANQVLKWADDARLAVVIYPHSEPFELITAMETGAAQRIPNPERIRDAAGDANNQLKNGASYKPAPGVLMIFHDGLDVPDEAVIYSALYGNLQYTFKPGAHAAGRLILDRDGAWSPTKNRTTSAMVYVRNDGEPLLVHNYWADRPLQAGRFGCKEAIALPNGNIATADFRSHAVRGKSLREYRARLNVSIAQSVRRVEAALKRIVARLGF